MRSISRPMGLHSDSQPRMSLAIGFYRWRQESPAPPASFPHLQFLRSGVFLTGGWDRIRFHQRRKMVGSCSGAGATALNSRE